MKLSTSVRPLMKVHTMFMNRHADCRMIPMLYPFLFLTFDYRFELITKIKFSNNPFEF